MSHLASQLSAAVVVLPAMPLSRRTFFSETVTDRDDLVGEGRVNPQTTPSPFQGYAAVDGIGHSRAQHQYTFSLAEMARPWLQGFSNVFPRTKLRSEGKPAPTLPRGWALLEGDPIYGMRPAFIPRRNIRRPDLFNYGLAYET
jgi:hypothetical protein